MSGANIWWDRVGSSRKLLDRVAKCLREGRSVAIQLPKNFPWPGTFGDLAAKRSTVAGRDRVREILQWEGGNPGKTLLQDLCSEEERLGYFPRMSVAAYLAGSWDLYLNRCFIWVTGIRDKGDMVAWTEFVEEYERLAEERLASCRERGGQHAVFVLMYDGPELENPRMEQIRYKIRRQDVRTFAMEMAVELDNADPDIYQAELAASLSEGDPELCAALLKKGGELIADPVNTAGQVLRTGRHTDGFPFTPCEEKERIMLVWLAQIALLFPVMERYRYEFVVRHESALQACLPVYGSDGKKVEDPYDLDIGELNHLLKNRSNLFERTEVETVALYREVRNKLAHIDVVSCDTVKQILK